MMQRSCVSRGRSGLLSPQAGRDAEGLNAHCNISSDVDQKVAAAGRALRIVYLVAAGAARALGGLPRQVLQLLADADGALARALLVAALPGRLALQHAGGNGPRQMWGAGDHFEAGGRRARICKFDMRLAAAHTECLFAQHRAG